MLNFNKLEQNLGIVTQCFIQPYSSDEDTDKQNYINVIPSVNLVTRELVDYSSIKHITVKFKN